MADGVRWLTLFIVERIHEHQIAEHGGEHGIRDAGLLQSALARPRNRYSYEGGADLYDLAADYAFGISRNHPFMDGNKRTAFLAAYVFLELNGVEIDADEVDVVVVMTALAAGELDQEALARWLRIHGTAE